MIVGFKSDRRVSLTLTGSVMEGEEVETAALCNQLKWEVNTTADCVLRTVHIFYV